MRIATLALLGALLSLTGCAIEGEKTLSNVSIAQHDDEVTLSSDDLDGEPLSLRAGDVTLDSAGGLCCDCPTCVCDPAGHCICGGCSCTPCAEEER